MLNPETMTVICGLGSAVAWGAGDFTGGFASRRGNALVVVLFSQFMCFSTFFLLFIAEYINKPKNV
jgi:hypothetical protein